MSRSPGRPVVDIAVAAFVDDGRVLLVHRHPGRQNHPDRWDLPGGHVEPGETPAAACHRECVEELGVQVREAQPVELTCSDPMLRKHAFVVTAWRGTPANLAPDEHDGLGWFDAAGLAALTLADPANLPDLLGLLRSAR